MKTINASKANRHFSKLLREVARGEVYTVLCRSKPVASITPAGEDASQRRKAKADLLERLNHQAVTGDRDWTRDELYRDHRSTQ